MTRRTPSNAFCQSSSFEFRKDEKVMVRNGMDILSFSPFLNSKVDDWEKAFDGVRRVIDSIE